MEVLNHTKMVYEVSVNEMLPQNLVMRHEDVVVMDRENEVMDHMDMVLDEVMHCMDVVLDKVMYCVPWM